MSGTDFSGIDHILASDLDGTLIPLDGSDANRVDLETLTRELREHAVPLIYVTGRHRESVIDAIRDFQLPVPAWLICDVGTSIFRPKTSTDFRPLDLYNEHQEALIVELPIAALQSRLSTIVGLRLQEPEKQGRFKRSYYVEADHLSDLSERIDAILKQDDAPYRIVSSVDPFNGDGLIDLLPRGVSKSYALTWLASHLGTATDSIVFAGDSGNDFAALTAGFRSIVVGNADRNLADRVRQAHRVAGWHDRLCLASNSATSGVLEGCRKFGIFDV